MDHSPIPPASAAPRPKTRRLDPAERRRILLDRATSFFAENGMAAPTRALAEACGVTQRLLYRYFPSKAALLEEVYASAILAPFKALWLVQLADRAHPVATRLQDFYADYYRTILSRHWLRLFLFSGLEGTFMASAYIDSIIRQLTELLVREAAAERSVPLPASLARIHELGWVLHGAVSHLAIRQHVYGAGQNIALDEVLAIHIAAFLDGLPAAAARARQAEDKGPEDKEPAAAESAEKVKSSVYD